MDIWNSDTLDEIQIPSSLLGGFPSPYSSLVRVEFAAITDQGKVRSGNEDSYLIFKTSRNWERLLTSIPDTLLPPRHEEVGYVMAIADGMGGHKGGAIASSLALRTGVSLILNAARWSLKIDDPTSRDQEIQSMVDRGTEIFQQIDRAIADQAIADPSLTGMGTTLTTTYSLGDDLFILHVGDSRAYLFREGKLQQLTRDHTLIQALLDAGTLTSEEAAQHRMRHVLTRAIGRGTDLQVAVYQTQLKDGDKLLLCSDGLSGMVNDDRIGTILAKEQPLQQTCENLTQEALDQGGKDNVTVLLAKYHLPPRTEGRQ